LRSQKYFCKAFLEVGEENTKNVTCIVVLHVKLRHQRIQIVEMREQLVLQVKIIDFFNVFFLIFRFLIDYRTGVTNYQIHL
jgi:hypothetical protein